MTPAELQADLFGKFNREGSTVTVTDRGDRFKVGLVDAWEVLRIAPHAGDSAGVDFWVVWREVGFLRGMQFTHVTHFTAFEKTDDNLLLTAVDRSVLQVDFLDDAERAKWDEFQREKAENAADYAEYYRLAAPEVAAMANSV